MEKLKHIWRGMSFRLIAGTGLLLMVFGWILSLIGYVRFTNSLTKEYNDAAFRTAETATTLINGDRIDEWEADGGTSGDYLQTAEYIDILTEKQHVTMIYVIDVDTTDYGRFTSVFNSVAADSEYSPWPIGYERDTTNDEYRQIYRDIYENGLERGSIVRLTELRGKPPHVTSLVPVKKSDGSVRAILCVQRPMSELAAGRRLYLVYVLIPTVVIVFLASMSIFSFMRGQFVRPMKKITREAARFAEENSAPKEGELVAISKIREIDKLASSIGRMEHDTLQYIENLTRVTAEKERMGTEISLASGIQRGILPQEFPESSRFTLYATMKPARQVGGDFYDFFMIDDDHLGLVIADVSGKGIPAALFMMVTKELIKNRLKDGDSPEKALYHVNNQLTEGNRLDMFVTVWLAVLELSTGRGVSANAGHEHPVVGHVNGNYELIKYKHSPALATMEDMEFKEHEFIMEHGDTIFVYTDGVAEATNKEDELFGTDRLIETLNLNPASAPARAVQGVMDAIDRFVGEAEQFDDITMLCIKYR